MIKILILIIASAALSTHYISTLLALTIVFIATAALMKSDICITVYSTVLS